MPAHRPFSRKSRKGGSDERTLERPFLSRSWSSLADWATHVSGYPSWSPSIHICLPILLILKRHSHSNLLKIKQEGLRGFSVLPLTRVPFWVPIVDPLPNGVPRCFEISGLAQKSLGWRGCRASLDVRIDDVWYDLSGWRKAHPGGEHWMPSCNWL